MLPVPGSLIPLLVTLGGGYELVSSTDNIIRERGLCMLSTLIPEWNLAPNPKETVTYCRKRIPHVDSITNDDADTCPDCTKPFPTALH